MDPLESRTYGVTTSAGRLLGRWQPEHEAVAVAKAERFNSRHAPGTVATLTAPDGTTSTPGCHAVTFDITVPEASFVASLLDGNIDAVKARLEPLDLDGEAWAQVIEAEEARSARTGLLPYLHSRFDAAVATTDQAPPEA